MIGVVAQVKQSVERRQSSDEVRIKKENIGLEDYQHHLFNNQNKRDSYCEDLNKIKVRFDKSIPNMQQIIQTDMKRININKLYDRQLRETVHGTRGLDWQHKEQLKRFKNDERDIRRELLRLNYDLAKISFSSYLNGSLNKNPLHHSTKKTKAVLKRSLLITDRRVSINFSTPTNQTQSSSSGNESSSRIRQKQFHRQEIKEFFA
ncbi:unnamed protein product [Adineta ricciae]|uniref:Uncharacterized protein n=1 Tax=Adineta ricciae TaxID=249248 RepID=A0A814T2L2_ADIRI|nr:unnamed protein product [Adineta ricciae]CAF1576052.1 unnamed protein product [Adineta ricciae]